MRKFEVIAMDDFQKEIKDLSKKYISIKKDVQNIIEKIKENPNMGDVLKCGLDVNPRKIRFGIKSKNSGKRGGGRLIVYIELIALEEKSVIRLFHVYDKSEKENIDTDIIGDEVRRLLGIP